jgi:hypothetical protein
MKIYRSKPMLGRYGGDGQVSSINQGMHPRMGCTDRLALAPKKNPYYTPPRRAYLLSYPGNWVGISQSKHVQGIRVLF